MLEISIECSQVEGSARPYNVQYRRDTNQPIKHRGWYDSGQKGGVVMLDTEIIAHQEELDKHREEELEDQKRLAYQQHREAIELDVKAAKFKRGSFTPMGANLQPRPDIEGLMYGPL